MKYIPFFLVFFAGCIVDQDPIETVIEQSVTKDSVIVSLKNEIRIMELTIDSLESQAVVDTDQILRIMAKLDGAKFKNVVNQDIEIRLSNAKKRVEYLEYKVNLVKKESQKEKVLELRDSLEKSDSVIVVLKHDIVELEQVMSSEHLSIVGLHVKALKKTGTFSRREVSKAHKADILYCSFSVPESNVIEHKEYYVNFKVHSVLDSSFIAAKQKIKYKGESQKIEVNIPLTKELMKGARNVSVEIEGNDTSISKIYLK